MPSYKNKTLFPFTGTQGSASKVLTPAESGWIGPVHFKNVTKADSDDAVVKVTRQGVEYVLAADSMTLQTDHIWPGCQWLSAGETLRITRSANVAGEVEVTWSYEPTTYLSTWDEFNIATTDKSSSSSSTSSEGYSSSSSIDSSSSSSKETISSSSTSYGISTTSSSSSVDSNSSSSSVDSSSSSEEYSSSSSSSVGYSSSSSSVDSSSSSSSVGLSSSSSSSVDSSSSSSSSSVGLSSSSSSLDSSSSSSLDVYAELYEASGFATVGVDGMYNPAGQKDGYPYYTNGTYYMFFDTVTSYWAISGDAFDPTPQWISSKDTANGVPSDNIWVNEFGIVYQRDY